MRQGGFRRKVHNSSVSPISATGGCVKGAEAPDQCWMQWHGEGNAEPNNESFVGDSKQVGKTVAQD